MQGTLLILKPDGKPERRALTGEPELEGLQKIVGGHIEVVPYFNSIEIDGVTRKCLAFCNEDGKGRRLPFNRMATVAWDRAMRRAGVATGLQAVPGLPAAAPGLADYLVGNVAIIIGDEVLRAMRTDHDEG